MKYRFTILKEDMSSEYDSEGNQLTREQVEFFKNSKVRDSKGRLLVCYHGTPYTFSTFSHNKTNGQLGADLGYWFTTDKHIAQRFANTHTNDDVLKILQYKKDKEKDYVNRAISILQPFTTKKLVADKETSSAIIASFHFGMIDKVLHKWGIVLDNKSRRELINLQNECIDFYKNEDEYVSQYQSQMASSATPTVMKVYLLANNVLQENGESIGVSWERYGVISNAEDEGYDAVIITNADTGAGFGTEIVVFDPNQIKSIYNKAPTNSDNINESLMMKDGMYVFDTASSLMNFLRNQKKDIRILYDANLDKYFACDGNEYIHWNILEQAQKEGYYHGLVDYQWELDGYQYTGVNGGWDENDEYIDPYLYYIIFSPDNSFKLGNDDYDEQYDTSIGRFLTRECDIGEIDLYDYIKREMK